MKGLLITLIALVSISAFAETKILAHGENLTVKCAAGSSISVQNTNTRSVNVTCESVCRLSAMTECEYQIASGNSGQCSGGNPNEFLIVASLPSGQLVKLSSNTGSRDDITRNLPRFADIVVEKGYCDKAVY